MILALLHLASLAGAAAPADDGRGCDIGNSDDVVVCGTRPGRSRYRLPLLPDRYEAPQIRAETNVIPGVNTRAHVDSVTMPDGYPSNRLMVTFSTPF